MGERRPEELINDLISFIKKERELYGDFSVSVESASETTAYDTKKTDPSTKNLVREPFEQQTKSSPTKNTTDMSDFDSQEGREVYSEIDKCDTLGELKELCKKAEVLKTDLENTNLVFGVGNSDADLMLVGEAPGAEEDKQGEPFVGAAGQLLNKILDAIGFSREDVYIANILKHRPPNNRNPLPEERERSLPFLLRQIDLIEPKLILCLGKVAAQTLLDNNNSLSSMRGKFHSFRDKYELMATYHPAALLRHPKWKRPTWEDVKMLRERYDELNGTP